MGRSADYAASLALPARRESVRAAAAFLLAAARDLEVPVGPLFEAAVVEALSNAVMHGGGGEEARVLCEIELRGRHLTVRVLDSGPSFTLPAPGPPGFDPEDLDSVPDKGYGLPIILAAFPQARTVAKGGLFGVEMPLPF